MMIRFCLLWFVCTSISLACTPRDKEVPISISRYQGRFGNNLMQIIQAFYVAQSFGLPVKLPSHRNKVLRWIANRTHKTPCVEIEPPAVNERAHEYFFVEQITRLGLPAPTNDDKKRIASFTIAPLLNFDADLTHLPLDHALVVHVRSGDIFSQTPHPNYWQPPLWWYLTIAAHFRLHHGRDAPLVVITEPDFANPVVGELRKGGWRIVSSTVEADFQALAQARSLGLSAGTFSRTAALCSARKRILYRAVFASTVREWYWKNDSTITVHQIYLDNYAQLPWRNTPEQRKEMIEYAPSRADPWSGEQNTVQTTFNEQTMGNDVVYSTEPREDRESDS